MERRAIKPELFSAPMPGADAPTRDLDKAVHCDYRKAYKTWHKREARRESISRIELEPDAACINEPREPLPQRGGSS